MKILSIESSCDDTGITIMEMHGTFSARGGSAVGGEILAHASNSQIKTHIPYGGVVPGLAKREHIKNLPILLERVLKNVKRNLSLRSPSQGDGPRMSKNSAEFYATPQGQNFASPIELIAVTYGPGLEPALWTGITFAQDLAKKWNVPVIPVNHMEGHILSVFGKNKGKFKIPKVKFPMLSLLVSGGHTQLVLSKKWLNYEILGETVDDAVGEAFDKVARMLGLPYPGGPEISRLAEAERKRTGLLLRTSSQRDGARKAIFQQENMRGEKKQTVSFLENFSAESPKILFPFSLPRPMLYAKNYNFSFSGLKTAVLYLIRDLQKINHDILQNDKMKAKIALEFENAAIECLIYKTKKAIEQYKIKTVSIGGGVAANQHLREEIRKITTPSPSSTRMGGFQKVKLLFPTQELSTDNSIMIGIAGYLQYLKNKGCVPKPESIKADGNLSL